MEVVTLIILVLKIHQSSVTWATFPAPAEPQGVLHCPARAGLMHHPLMHHRCITHLRSRRLLRDKSPESGMAISDSCVSLQMCTAAPAGCAPALSSPSSVPVAGL